MISLYHRFGAFYSSSFTRHPWATLAFANGTLGVVADSLAQYLEKIEAERSRKTSEQSAMTKSQGWNAQRSGRFLAFGLVMAPILAEWNKYIEYRFPLRPASISSATTANVAKFSLLALGKRVAFDQILL